MNNSRKGKKFEYAVRDHLRERGHIAHLISRSKPFDIVAWLPNSERAFLIECTTEKVTPKKVRSFLANTEKITAWRVLAEKRKGKIQFYEVAWDINLGQYAHFPMEVDKLATT